MWAINASGACSRREFVCSSARDCSRLRTLAMLLQTADIPGRQVRFKEMGTYRLGCGHEWSNIPRWCYHSVRGNHFFSKTPEKYNKAKGVKTKRRCSGSRVRLVFEDTGMHRVFEMMIRQINLQDTDTQQA